MAFINLQYNITLLRDSVVSLIIGYKYVAVDNFGLAFFRLSNMTSTSADNAEKIEIIHRSYLINL